MKAESWFEKELKAIHPDLYPLWMNKYGKWFIVHDTDMKVAGITEYDPVSGKNVVVDIIVEDENHNPLPLDRAVLNSLRAMKYYQNKEVDVDKEEDEREKQLMMEARRHKRDGQRYFLKWHKRFTQTKTFVFGGI